MFAKGPRQPRQAVASGAAVPWHHGISRAVRVQRWLPLPRLHRSEYKPTSPTLNLAVSPTLDVVNTEWKRRARSRVVLTSMAAFIA